MSIIGFSHYNLRAPRDLLDQLKDFYVNVVGLTDGPRPPFRSFGYWLYAGEKDVLHLTQTGANETRAINVKTTFDHVAFSSQDWESIEVRLREHGVEYDRDVVPERGDIQLFFKDPAGNGIEINFDTDQAGEESG